MKITFYLAPFNRIPIMALLWLGLVFRLDGQILRNQILDSKILGQNVRYDVYLPPGYDSAKAYPVLFYLHWFGGDNHSANDFMTDIDRMIIRKDFPEIIVIAPDAKRTWYIDDYGGTCKYASMFMSEFVPAMQRKYHLAATPAKRAIMGTSMGGFGALRFAMRHPDEFGICLSFMAGISTTDQIVKDNDDDYLLYHHDLYGKNLKGAERANEYFVRNNPLYIAQQVDPGRLKQTQWYIQCCDNDYHSLANAELHAVFHRLGVVHEFRINDGAHDGDCVQSSLPDALAFLKKVLE